MDANLRHIKDDIRQMCDNLIIEIIGLDDQKLDFERLVDFEDPDIVAEEIVNELGEWAIHYDSEKLDDIIKISHLVLDWVIKPINHSTWMVRDSILWGLYVDLRYQVDNLDVQMSQFRYILRRNFLDRTENDSKADLLYLLLSFKLEKIRDMPEGSLAALFEYDVNAVNDAYDDGRICL